MSANSRDNQSGERSIRLKNLEIERKRLEKENEEKRKTLLELQKREMLIKKATENGELYASIGGLEDKSNKRGDKEETVLDDRNLEIHIEKEEDFINEESKPDKSVSRSSSSSASSKSSSRHSSHMRRSHKRSKSSSIGWRSKRHKTEKNGDVKCEKEIDKDEKVERKEQKMVSEKVESKEEDNKRGSKESDIKDTQFSSLKNTKNLQSPKRNSSRGGKKSQECEINNRHSRSRSLTHRRYHSKNNTSSIIPNTKGQPESKHAKHSAHSPPIRHKSSAKSNAKPIHHKSSPSINQKSQPLRSQKSPSSHHKNSSLSHHKSSPSLHRKSQNFHRKSPCHHRLPPIYHRKSPPRYPHYKQLSYHNNSPPPHNFPKPPFRRLSPPPQRHLSPPPHSRQISPPRYRQLSPPPHRIHHQKPPSHHQISPSYHPNTSSPPPYTRSVSPSIETSSKLDYVFTDAKYFLIKSSNHENVALGQAKNIWSTPPPNESKFNQAFNNHSNVILIFSIKESGNFQGYARIRRESDHSHPPIRWVLPLGISAKMLNAVFHLQWINRKELSFDKVIHLRNTLNEGRCVKIGRDGQEVDEMSGEALCRLFPRDPSINLRLIAQEAKDSLKKHDRTVAETRERINRLLREQDEARKLIENEKRLYEEDGEKGGMREKEGRGYGGRGSGVYVNRGGYGDRGGRGGYDGRGSGGGYDGRGSGGGYRGMRKSGDDLRHYLREDEHHRRPYRGRYRGARRRPSYRPDLQRRDFYSRSPDDLKDGWEERQLADESRRSSRGSHYGHRGTYSTFSSDIPTHAYYSEDVDRWREPRVEDRRKKYEERDYHKYERDDRKYQIDDRKYQIDDRKYDKNDRKYEKDDRYRY